MKRTLLLLMFLPLLIACQEGPKNVLIIGDSISIGYTPIVKQSLSDVAVVRHNFGNAQYTGNGLDSLDSWLGDIHWDVIHFNFGLHDLAYKRPGEKTIRSGKDKGKKKNVLVLDKVNGQLRTPLDDYGENLELLVRRLEKTGAELIFATTTVVPPEEPGRFTEDVARYNEVALKVMEKHHIPVNDLYTLSLKVHPELGLGKDNVHYSKEGYQLLAEPVTRMITQRL